MANKTSNQEMSGDTKTIITIVLLLFVWPVGLILMWLWMKWPIWLKVFLTIIPFIIVIFILFILGTIFVQIPASVWSTSPGYSTLVQQQMSSGDLVKDANSKVQKALELQNKGNLTDVENEQKISLITQALSEYEQATKKDPSNVEAWQSIAVINEKLGDGLGSQSSEQIMFYNESARAYYNLGQVYLQKGLKGEARTVLQLALELAPSTNTTLRDNIQQALEGI